MSEYWVSHKKYFCKYCNIYIADDKPSRTQHETGLKHKGNVERFVRNLYKTGEKRKADLEEEKREMVRIQRAADAAYAQDVSSGLVKPGSSSTLPKPKEAEPSKPTKSSDPYANYSTAQSLGITDPDEERRKAEAERRRQEGVAGDWQFVAVAEPNAEEAPAVEPSQVLEPVAVAAAPEGASRKREAEAPPDDDDMREFKLRKKKLNVGLGEIYDPGVIPIKLKTKKEEPSEQSPASSSTAFTPVSTSAIPSSATPLPKWTSRGWSKPGESKGSEPSVPQEKAAESTALESVPKAEPSFDEPPISIGVKVEEHAEAKQETVEAPPPPAGGSMFRKRKGPAASVGSRGRQV